MKPILKYALIGIISIAIVALCDWTSDWKFSKGEANILFWVIYLGLANLSK